ncbi:MAG: hypothetical protein LBE91_07055 [Tannerella sp.]|jgi:hypothetical protein|nr:hypothetical protein [Tannerella sp.]
MKSKTKSNKGAMETGKRFRNGVRVKSRMNRINLLLFIYIPLFLVSCSSAKIYTKADAKSYSMRHRTLAILPPRINIEAGRKDNPENRQAQETTETINAQNEIYSRFLYFVQREKLYLDIQPIEKTNAKFSEIENLYDMPPDELAEILDVDAVLYTDCILSSKKNVAGGIVYAIIFFPYGTPVGIMMATMSTNSVDINMKLYDGPSGYLLYSYNNGFAGLGTKYVFLIDRATKKAIKKMPHYRK